MSWDNDALERWRGWVAAIGGGASIREIGRRIGRSDMTAASQLALRDREDGRTPIPHPEAVVAFARAHGADPKRALVVAGLLTEDEATRGVATAQLTEMSLDQLGQLLIAVGEEIGQRAGARDAKKGKKSRRDGLGERLLGWTTDS
ncbi:hypothetical protein GPX89_09095 [Nocardia sp. ET3-3]|uniref:Uncharacterized protein n=1 Tax=Nocardia terrae TaxID=2675851 RepID=A0A7K1USS6_9NOCA|nr:hypothetical protein [Nocardia terrae]MVU77402.1 hypothetical protein [Nocardia terrae]